MSKPTLVCMCFLTSLLGVNMFGSPDTNNDGCVNLEDYSQIQTAFSGPCTPRHKAYLKAVIRPGATTVQNPMRNKRLTFFITDIWYNGHDLTVVFPPELQHERAGNVSLLEHTFEGSGATVHLASPVPLTTSITFSEGSMRTLSNLILEGFYGSTPDVVALN